MRPNKEREAIFIDDSLSSDSFNRLLIDEE